MINRSKEKFRNAIKHFRHKCLGDRCNSAEINFEAILELQTNQRRINYKIFELEERLEELEHG